MAMGMISSDFPLKHDEFPSKMMIFIPFLWLICCFQVKASTK